MAQTLPYGSWPSPIAAADIAGGSPRLDGARFVGDEIWWSESVPSERGRTAVFRLTDDEPEALLPAPWNARSRVHEYGGGAWTVTPASELLFVEGSDQRVHRLTVGGAPEPLTPAGLGMSFGDLTFAAGPDGGGRLWAVRETHAGDRSPVRDIVVIPLDGSAADDPEAILSVVAGSDFLAYPAPRGDRLAWIAWDHPDMPWDASELRVGRIGPDGRVSEHVVVAGGRTEDGGISALQPEWTGDDELMFTADPEGRWNLHWVRFDGLAATGPEPIYPADADTGGPLWNLATRWFAALDDGRIVAVRTHGADELIVIDPTCGAVDGLETSLTGGVLVRDAQGSRVLLTGAGIRVPGGLWLLDVDARTLTALRGGVSALAPEWMPTSRAVTFEGPDGDVHAFAYPPTNPDATAPEGELPPYLVLVHGGPTAHASGELSLAVAYFTSRGIGVLDVNYGGSTGYGRAYRERLRGRWGIVDVADTAAAARGLAAAGLADPARIAIKGGSAGGWTVLCAVADTDVFAAGISRYGVADLRRLADDTHDFEARYLDGLVGPLPQAEPLYVSRSPLSRPETLRTPLLILQGADDPVVPPSQSEALRDALAANGVPHKYLLFEGESHGFRQAETLVRAFEAELAFLGAILGFETPGVPPIDLD
ncbi:peptidase S9 [Microbacterium sp. Root53]|uniref:S9 family peptidase n=1 Tax=Microbacterium sp. Root53 TaxID=1736553 RepID=UPI000700B2F4|nr:prolyl oligopeptidase family serine peptidase [Microbacterium sp. Root53]KQY97093.1 peptidase S9 [Microbacterium sp. Root53]